MTKLIVMCGASGSGKSTTARQIQKENPSFQLISTDDLREELLGDANNQSQGDYIFKVAYNRIRYCLEHGFNVIFDATNLRARDRKAIIKKYNDLDISLTCAVVCAEKEECKSRQSLRARQVPFEVIDKQFAKFQKPTMEEGWNEIKYYRT